MNHARVLRDGRQPASAAGGHHVVRWIVLTLVLSCLSAVAGGCANTSPGASAGRSEVTAQRSRQAIVCDGRLDEPVWEEAVVYSLTVPADARLLQGGSSEHGTVRYAWDEHFLYVGFDLVDLDIVQENEKDQQHHYRSGDVAEVFLKPHEASHYWEFHVTPHGHCTVFFFPGRGRVGLASNLDYQTQVQTAALVRGRINDWRGDDQGWTAEIAVPRDELARAGVPLDDVHAWTVLAGRYNFGRHLPTIGPEVTCYPGLSESRFHRYETHAALRLRDSGD